LSAPQAQRDAALVLQQRAAALARAKSPEQDGTLLQVLEFNIAGQDCALELRWLREVRPLRGVVELPHAAPGVIGVAHVRGRMLALLDIAPLLGLPAGRVPAEGALLVVGAEAPAFALAADGVGALRGIAPRDVEHRSAPLAAVRPDSAIGITASGHLLLDGAWLIRNFKDFPA